MYRREGSKKETSKQVERRKYRRRDKQKEIE